MKHEDTSRAPRVAVAGLSARLVAQSAARAGFDVVALDIFGDRDTREAASMWFDIGASGLSIDRARLVDALADAARLPRMLGLIVTGGLEPLAGELNRARNVPRFIGNGLQAQVVRDPRRFFALLDEADITHPEVCFTAPSNSEGWLIKHSDGCGGTHIERLEDGGDVGETAYFQRLAPGRSMSALFLAAHRKAVVIGFAEQLSVQAGRLPFVHAGALGPVDLPARMAERVIGAIEHIVWKTDLAGLNSIDFLLDDSDFRILEINTRPSSTMALYEAAWPDIWPRGLIGAHLDACLHGVLPAMRHTAFEAPSIRAGQRVAFSPASFTVSGAFSDACFDDPHCHDVPLAGARIEAGHPVCTLSATAPTLDDVRIRLDDEHARLLQRIETS